MWIETTDKKKKIEEKNYFVVIGSYKGRPSFLKVFNLMENVFSDSCISITDPE